MDQTRSVCLLFGSMIFSLVFFPSAAQAGVGVSPSTINFGTVAVNSASSATFVVMNNGSSNLPLDSVSSNLSQMKVSGPALPLTLRPGTSASFHVTFQPTSASTFTGSIAIRAGHRGGQVTNLSVSGAGVNPVAPPPPATYLLSPSVSSLAFGNLAVGTQGSLPFTVTNTGTGSVSISQVVVSGAGFSVSGFSGAVTLAPSQSLSLAASFAPSAAGSFSGSLSIASTATNSPTAISLTGSGVAATTYLLSLSRGTLSFGNQTVGTTGTLPLTMTNTGTGSVSVSQVSASGTGFSLSGFSGALTLAPGKSASVSVTFSPPSAGSSAGSVTVVSTATNSPASVTLSGTGVPSTLLLSANPTSLSFGNQSVGASTSQNVTLTNTGNSSVTVSQLTVSGTGFTLSALSLPLTLSAGQTASFSVVFAPAAAGSASGSVSAVSNATNSPPTVSLSGTGVKPMISVTPSSAAFGNVTLGVTNTQTITVQNPGTATLTVSQASVTGAGYSLSGLTTPLSVAPGGSSSFNVAFAPTSAGSIAGSITLTNNASNPALSIPLSGTGVSSILQLSASPNSLSFGNLAIGTSATQTVTVSNTGNASVTISQITASGTGFSLSPIGLPVTLAAGQTTSFNVAFAPASAGSVTGSVTVTSNAANSPLVLGLSGTAATSVSHSVSLNWTPSSSTFSGFNIYRSATSGGPYSRSGTSMVSTTSYLDSNVSSGQTYYYVATEVDTAGDESSYSNEVRATIP